MRRAAAFSVAWMLGTAVTLAQTPPPTAGIAPAPADPQAPAAAAPAAPAPPSDANYTYQSEGRRDPFMSLLTAGVEARTAASHKKGDGPAGMSVGEISVRGVLESRGTLVAMVQGPDNKTYLVHAGDKFVDGSIKAITRDGLVVVQDVNDPLSLVKQREIRKLLRSAEDAKK